MEYDKGRDKHTKYKDKPCVKTDIWKFEED